MGCFPTVVFVKALFDMWFVLGQQMNTMRKSSVVASHGCGGRKPKVSKINLSNLNIDIKIKNKTDYYLRFKIDFGAPCSAKPCPPSAADIWHQAQYNSCASNSFPSLCGSRDDVRPGVLIKSSFSLTRSTWCHPTMRPLADLSLRYCTILGSHPTTHWMVCKIG